MRLALVGPVHPYRGGIAHYTTMLCRALRQRGHDVLLVSFRRQYPQWLFPGRSDKDSSEVPLEAEGARYWIDSLNPFTWLATARRLAIYRPDVLVLQWWTSFWAPVWLTLSAFVRLWLRRPVVFLCHNVLPHESHWCDAWLSRLVLSWGQRFVVSSAAEAGLLESLLPGSQIHVSPLPLFSMFVDGQVLRDEARRALNLPQGVPLLLFFGIVRPYKGLRYLLEAIPLVRAHLCDVMLVVAGEFWEDRRLYEEQIRRLGIGDSVVLEDRYIPNEQVPLYFSAADLFVAPYDRVTGSAALQMARSFGLPVLTTKPDEQPGGVRVPWSVVPRGDAEALAAATIDFFARDREEEHVWRDLTVPPECSWDKLASVIEAGVS